MKIKIAVDVGRSSVKFASGDTVRSFPFLVSTRKVEMAKADFLSSDVLLWADIDGVEYLLGDTARLLGDAVLQHTEGQAFQRASVVSTLFAIALVLRDRGVFLGADVTLAINLTFNNLFMKQSYVDILKGEHTVAFKKGNPVTFKISSVAVLPQGFSGFMEVAMDRHFQVKPEFRDSQGAVIDIGRRTIDFLYIDSFISKDGVSRDFGTFKVFNRVGNFLQERYSVSKEPYEIESYYIQNKKISLLSGERISVLDLVEEAVSLIAEDVMTYFETANSSHTPEFLVLLGGGAYLFGDYFKKKYPSVFIPDNPHVANVLGMLKFISRVA